MKKFSVRLFAFVLAVIVLVPSFVICSFADNGDKTDTYTSIDESDALYVNDTKLYNRRGEEVRLRGVNLGGWLIMEDWFCPVDNDTSGDLVTINKLTERFGAQKTAQLYNIYRDNWIIESDFKNIADMGFNCVRIPFWYRNFQSDENGTWITDENGEIDLSRLEWAVDMCRKYGIYAVLDLHGANGCQGYADHCGLKTSDLDNVNYHFFDRNAQGKWYREQAVELWRVIAERFSGDPAVAMFDLLNEPLCSAPAIQCRHDYVWEFYNDCYNTVRSVDKTRILTMIGSWSVNKLPDPRAYNWRGVVYQYHQYDKQESDYTSRVEEGWKKNYNVPLYAGEFHPTSGDVTLFQAIQAYDSNNMSWSLWTYKGYNSWSTSTDWFAYSSGDDSLKVNADEDSYETIAYKWGAAMRTDSGNFVPGGLYPVAKQFIPSAVLDSAPMNTQADADSAVFVQREYSGELHGPSDYGTVTFFEQISAFFIRIAAKINILFKLLGSIL